MNDRQKKSKKDLSIATKGILIGVSICILASVVFLIAYIPVLREKNPFGVFNSYHIVRAEQDLERGREYTSEYVRTKYGFEPEIVFIHPIMKKFDYEILPIHQEWYTGVVYCECQTGEKSFNTFLRVQDRVACDNYQKEEIRKRITTEAQKFEGLTLAGAHCNSTLCVPDFEVKDRFNKQDALAKASSDPENPPVSNWEYYAEEYFDENTDLKQFLSNMEFHMALYSDRDLAEVDYETIYRVFPEYSIKFRKRFPEGEHWDCFPCQQDTDFDASRIKRYMPKLVGSAEVSTCDGTDFTVVDGIILEGEWDGGKYIPFDPLESYVYTCQFGEYKDVRFGFPYGWEAKDAVADISSEIEVYVYYQYRDEKGTIRTDAIYRSETRTVYTDMLTLMYAKKKAE